MGEETNYLKHASIVSDRLSCFGSTLLRPQFTFRDRKLRMLKPVQAPS